ncbi:hypothetical protein ES703_100854 [subsurface metagenome]
MKNKWLGSVGTVKLPRIKWSIIYTAVIVYCYCLEPAIIIIIAISHGKDIATDMDYMGNISWSWIHRKVNAVYLGSPDITSRITCEGLNDIFR